MKIPHGPAQWVALFTTIAFVASAVAVGLTTFVGALPAGTPPNIGAWLTAISGGVGALALGIYGALRVYNAKLHQAAGAIAAVEGEKPPG